MTPSVRVRRPLPRPSPPSSINAEEKSPLLDAIRANYNEGMVDFNENLRQLVELQRIDKTTALEFSPNPEQLRMALKGIKVAASGLV